MKTEPDKDKGKDNKDTVQVSKKTSAKHSGKQSAKVFDVMRPGKAIASPTSRPVIIGHKQSAQNAQIAVSGIGEAQQPILNTRRKIELKPLGEPADSPEPTSVPASDAQPAQPVVQTSEQSKETEALASAALEATTEPPEGMAQAITPEQAAQPEQDPEDQPSGGSLPTVKPGPPVMPAASVHRPKPVVITPPQAIPDPPSVKAAQAAAAQQQAQQSPPPDQSATQPAPHTPREELVPDVAVQESPSQQAQPVAPVANDQKHEDSHIQPLFNDSGDIVVSTHNHHRHRAAKLFLTLVLLLLLAAAAFDAALDYGLITVNGVPHTHYLKNLKL